MKCINCDTDNNLKDRTANMGRCKSCNHPFAFEPTAMPTASKLTDPFFAKLIIDISANNTLFFTPRQLYYLLDKRLRSRFSKVNIATNPPEKILPPPRTVSLPAAPNPEVTAYSFDRVVVCDKSTIAQLLISNNFHFENNCAILTIDGYPQSIFTTTMEMLRRNPDLKVYALHNCSPNGVKLIRRLREETWFPNPEIPIIDVGTLPRQIMENTDVMTPQSDASAQTAQQLDSEIRASLNPEELAWLDAGCYLELESFPPQKLIQILQRAINESRELAAIEGDGMVVIDSYSYYTVDSFG